MEIAKTIPEKPPILKKRKYRGEFDHAAGYVFISPWLIGFFVFTIIPIIASLYLSFTRYDILSAPVWIGLENYKTIFLKDERFWKALKVTFFYVFVHVPIRLSFALAVAMLFRVNRPMVGLYRTIFYIPSVIGGSVAVAVMWRQLFGVEGALNSILVALGIIEKGFGWIGDPRTAIWTLILLAVWQFGSPMLIFLAGLKQIPNSLYEAASIDGANRWRKFTNITIPSLTPIIFFNFIMQTINGFMAFTQCFVITEGGPFDSTLFYAVYLFQKTFSYYEMGYGSALAWILLVIVAIFTGIIFKSSSYWVYYESKEN
ncbi:MAG: pectin-derived oligosaccharide transport system permease protein [Petroclostridium sp.]|uniref:carbohydrate ABC transporter permease n=1 Tax=Petroclostridium xylanilyticum TaxID=1792311 RepID=UPI003119CD71|nr:carbohydrate transporter rane protein 1, family [Clostridia bacterium]MDK2810356.1 pectin-derived oligosaccharide transport system permease protein [Petroclostridium sp.]